MTHDPVNSPAHYAEGRQYEPIAVIEDWELGYRLGNALKYISRAGRKQNTLEDLKKAAWYLSREIEAHEVGSPYRTEYEDVVDYYGQSTENDAWPADDVDEIGDTGFSVNDGIPGAAGTDGLPFDHHEWHETWDEFDAWDASIGPTEVTLTQAEIDEVLSRKALHQFTGNEIVATIEKRGLILGVKKDGSTCELGGNGKCL